MDHREELGQWGRLDLDTSTPNGFRAALVVGGYPNQVSYIAYGRTEDQAAENLHAKIQSKVRSLIRNL